MNTGFEEDDEEVTVHPRVRVRQSIRDRVDRRNRDDYDNEDIMAHWTGPVFSHGQHARSHADAATRSVRSQRRAMSNPDGTLNDMDVRYFFLTTLSDAAANELQMAPALDCRARDADAAAAAVNRTFLTATWEELILGFERLFTDPNASATSIAEAGALKHKPWEGDTVPGTWGKMKLVFRKSPEDFPPSRQREMFINALPKGLAQKTQRHMGDGARSLHSYANDAVDVTGLEGEHGLVKRTELWEAHLMKQATAAGDWCYVYDGKSGSSRGDEETVQELKRAIAENRELRKELANQKKSGGVQAVEEGEAQPQWVALADGRMVQVLDPAVAAAGAARAVAPPSAIGEQRGALVLQGAPVAAVQQQQQYYEMPWREEWQDGAMAAEVMFAGPGGGYRASPGWQQQGKGAGFGGGMGGYGVYQGKGGQGGGKGVGAGYSQMLSGGDGYAMQGGKGQWGKGMDGGEDLVWVEGLQYPVRPSHPKHPRYSGCAICRRYGWGWQPHQARECGNYWRANGFPDFQTDDEKYGKGGKGGKGSGEPTAGEWRGIETEHDSAQMGEASEDRLEEMGEREDGGETTHREERADTRLWQEEEKPRDQRATKDNGTKEAAEGIPAAHVQVEGRGEPQPVAEGTIEVNSNAGNEETMTIELEQGILDGGAERRGSGAEGESTRLEGSDNYREGKQRGHAAEEARATTREDVARGTIAPEQSEEVETELVWQGAIDNNSYGKSAEARSHEASHAEDQWLKAVQQVKGMWENMGTEVTDMLLWVLS